MAISHCLSHLMVKNGTFVMTYIGKHSFFTKPRHVMPQKDCLGKTSPVVRVSTHIYGVFEEIDWKMFIFRVNLDM